jgi:hypothetical protein
MSLRLLLVVSLALLAWQNTASAARPFMTDDARLTTEGSCQLESWTRRYSDRLENWALPACNPTGNFEITAGGGRFSADGQSASHDRILQAKTLFRPMQTNDWGWGLAVGRAGHSGLQPGPNNLGNTYAYVPMSVSMRDDRVVVHANVGWVQDRQSRSNATTWGTGVEYWVHPKVMVIAESFGDDRQRPWVQTGVRFSVVPGLFQIDLTRGAQASGQGRHIWNSFGLRYTPDKLF